MPQNPNHIKAFSRSADSYNRYNIIQKEVASTLLDRIDYQPRSILDLGAGSGAIYKLIDWELDRFVAVDQSPQMCQQHAQGMHIEVICENFDDPLLYDRLGNFELVIASSSLQWSQNLSKIFEQIARHSNQIAFAIFCDRTFQTIYQVTNRKSFLPKSVDLMKLLRNYFFFEHELKEYRLTFEDNLSKFRYIKRSGVSGGERQLSYAETKNLIRNYPLDYLEFEVLFVWGRSKKS